MAKHRLFNGIVISLFFLLTAIGGYCADEESSLFWPSPPAPAKVVFVKAIYFPDNAGIKAGLFKKLKTLIIGEEKDILNKPIAVAVDKQKTIYVCDSGMPAVHIFMQKEKRYKKITAAGKEEFLSPVGVAVSDNGLVFIADSGLKKVFCLDGEGRFKFTIGAGEAFLRPTGLAVIKNRLYVADTLAHSISIFDLNGNFITRLGTRGRGDGEFNYPTSLATDKEGRVYVVDTLNFRIQVFDEANKFLYSIGQPGDSSGSFARPKGIGVDSLGHIYVTDALFDNIQVFNHNKEFLLSLGEAGHKAGEFWIPCGLAIDSEDYIYVADSYNQRLQIFRYVGKE